jgi:hypothetical protein
VVGLWKMLGMVGLALIPYRRGMFVNLCYLHFIVIDWVYIQSV